MGQEKLEAIIANKKRKRKAERSRRKQRQAEARKAAGLSSNERKLELERRLASGVWNGQKICLDLSFSWCMSEKEMGKMMTAESSEGCWWNDQRFDHYWRTYRAARRWQEVHREAVSWASSSCPGSTLLPPPPPRPPWQKTEKTKTPVFKRKSDPVALFPEPNEETVEPVPDERVDAIVQNEQMTEEMRAFFKQTIEHRKQRDAEKRRLNNSGLWFVSTAEEAVEPDQVQQQSEATVLPPTRKDRIGEAKQKFGDGAERIIATEALLRMHFDQEFNKHKPSFWPNIPLKL